MARDPDDDRPFPPDDELIVGLVGAVGIDLESVFRTLRLVLNEFDYQVHDVHLSREMNALAWDQPLPDEPFDEHVAAFMDAGDRLRSEACWDRNDAFALLAAHRVAVIRGRLTGDIDRPAPRQAFVLRSLKRPEEATLLRQIYGSRFVLLACYSPAGRRRAYLEGRIRESRVRPFATEPVATAADLMARDERGAESHGQNVRDTFHRADFFVDASDFEITAEDHEDGQLRPRFEIEIRRTMDILFGSPSRTPSRDEFGMTQAAAAMRRSAELGRQVGAAICTPDGDVIAVGANEVPKPGGGLYWEGDHGDAREFRKGRDTSDERKRRIAEEIVTGLEKARLLGEGVDAQDVLSEIDKTGLDDVIEFVRAVHAEMAALVDAARRGISVDGCTVFVTTFPCHHCARHLVAAGIKRVVYVAPYAKSLAEELHGDALVVTSSASLAPDDAGVAGSDPLVRFEPFTGVAPRRYMELFDMPARKHDSGELVRWERATAMPRLADLEPWDLRTERLPYLWRERAAQHLLGDVTSRRSPALIVEPPPVAEAGEPDGGPTPDGLAPDEDAA